MDPTRLSFRAFAVLFAALFALAAAPLWQVEILPLFDYPNHLARMGLLAELPQSATLRQAYEAVWRPIPNVAMDAIVPPLLRVIPLA